MSTLRVNAITDAAGTGNATPIPLGVGQTWQNLTGSRAKNTVYTNSTGRPIQIVVVFVTSSGNGQIRINGSIFVNVGQSSANGVPTAVSAIIPNGNTYELVEVSGTIATISNWAELR